MENQQLCSDLLKDARLFSWSRTPVIFPQTRGIFEVELFSYQLAVLLESSQESYDACLQSCRDSPELKEGVFVEGLQDFTDRSLLLNDV